MTNCVCTEIGERTLENDFLSVRYGGRFGPKPVKRRLQEDRAFFLEASPDGANGNPVVTPTSGKQQVSQSAPGGCRLLIAEDDETLALNAFDFQPIAIAAGSVGAVPALGDNAFETEGTGIFQTFAAIAANLLREPDRRARAFKEVLQKMASSTNSALDDQRR